MCNFTNTYVLAHLCVQILVNDAVYIQTTTKELLQYITMYFAYKTTSVVEKMYFVNKQNSQSTHITVASTNPILGAKPPLLLDTYSYCTCMHAVKKGRRLENRKFFELKSGGYRDGIRRKETR